MRRDPTKYKPAGGGRAATGVERASGRAAATYDLVLRTSIELFSERGFHGTSMRQLAARGELQPSGFYYYFDSKYEALMAIIESATTELEEAADAVPDDLPPDQALSMLVAGHVRVHLVQLDLARVFDRELRVLKTRDLKRIIGRLDAYEKRFRDTLAAGVQEGSFAADLDVPIAAMSILQMGTGVVEWWQPKGRLSVDEIAEMIGGFALTVARGGVGQPAADLARSVAS